MSDLFSTNQRRYGKKYKDHLFEQYKLFISSAENISDRRAKANDHFIAVNGVLMTVIGLIFQFKIFEDAIWLKALFPVFGLIICIIFRFKINAYKQLNTGKFKVIHEIEEKLPLALYKYEWVALGEGKDRKKYYPFSHIELLIPVIFGIIYILLAVYFTGFLGTKAPSNEQKEVTIQLTGTIK